MTSSPSPAISVIIPHLNQPGQLGTCLRSLAAQNYDLTEVEIIVVDNGSRELPTEICRPYANVQLASEETPGPGPARNKGIGISRAPILAFIDADCIADGNWLQAIADAFRNPATEVIGGDVRIALADSSRMTMLEAYESIYAYRQQEYIERQGFSGTGNLAMRRAVHQKVGPFAGIGVAEDREWGQRATAIGTTIAYWPPMKVFHPARKTFAELRAKWDRHVAHDYAEQVHTRLDRLRWLGKAGALAISPIWETARILKSERLDTAEHRLLAFRVLVGVRLHRALRAFAVLFRTERATRGHQWNRGHTNGPHK